MFKSVLYLMVAVATHLLVSAELSAQRPLVDPRAQVGAMCLVTRTSVHEGEPVPIDIHFDNHSGAGRRYGIGLDWEVWLAAESRWRSAGYAELAVQVDVRPGLSVHFAPDSLATTNRAAGKWRVRARCGQSEDPLAERLRSNQCFITPWTEVIITKHDRNRVILAGEKGPAAQEAMRNALLASEPWTTDQLTALLGLRARGVSPRVAARAELVAARPALRRLAGTAPGPAVTAEAEGLRQWIVRAGDSIDAEVGNWGGLRGDYLEDLYMLEGILDMDRHTEIANQIRLEYPGRYEGLEQRWRDVQLRSQQRYQARR